MSGINIIRRWVIQSRLKEQTKQGGVMITLPPKNFVDLNTSITADRLLRSGIDIDQLTSVAQVENLINRINKLSTRVISQDDPRFKGIMESLMGKKGEVVDMTGKKIPPGSKIMGGKAVDDDLPPPGSRGGEDDIAAPVQSSEESLKSMIEAENKKGIAKIKQRQKMLDDAIEDASPGFANDIKYDAEIVAENLAERMGLVYDDLPTKQRLDLYDQAYTGLSKKRFKQRESLEDFVDDAGGVDESDPRGIDDFIPDPEDMAKGGRVGFRVGSGEGKDTSGRDYASDTAASRSVATSPSRDTGGGGDDTTYDYTYPKEIVKQVATNTAKNLARNKIVDVFGLSKFSNPLGIAMVLRDFYNQTQNPQITDEEMQYEKGGIARIGLKDGMNRRNFLKILGGALSIPIVGRFFKPVKTGKTVTKTPVIATGDVAGKPEWFDSLVNRVIMEGDDVTKKFATKDREIVHTKKIDDDNEVTVYQDLDEGTIRVDYDSPFNMGEDTVSLQYKPGRMDESTGKKPRDEFEASELEPRYVGGPEDADIEFDGLGGGSDIRMLESDVSKLKEYATGQKPTLKEFVESKKRKDRVKAINEDTMEQAEYISGKYGDGPEPDFDDIEDFARGGIAKMLGE